MMDDPDLEVDNERFDGGEENGDEGGEEGVTYKEIEIREQDRWDIYFLQHDFSCLVSR